MDKMLLTLTFVSWSFGFGELQVSLLLFLAGFSAIRSFLIIYR